MSEGTGPWQGAAALSREEAVFQQVLQGDEQIIWTWVEGGRGCATPLFVGGQARRIDSLPKVAFGLVCAAVMGAILTYGDGRRRDLHIALLVGSIGIALFNLALFVGPERWRSAAMKAAAQMDEWSDALSGPGTLHALTQHRLLSTRSGAFSAIPLEPGEPVIQYGKFRIDRPDFRGRRLIDRIPMPEQHRLFAALKRARAIREGRDTGEVA